jgi:hypothetical protein
MRLPDFYIIGAAKAGTTSLHQVLMTHPDIFMPSSKEPEFFARDDLYAKGLVEYAALFEPAQPRQLCGEASTIYSLSPLFPHTAARIRHHTPDAKFIYVMREPVARAYSFYVQLVKNHQNESGDYSVRRSFEDCLCFPPRKAIAPRAGFLAGFDAHLPDTPELILAGSDYLAQIMAYLEHFDRSRFLFASYERYAEDPQGFLHQICRFLGLDPARMTAAQEVRANTASQHFATAQSTLAMKAIKRRLGPVGRLARALPSGLKRPARALAARLAPSFGNCARPRPMEPETNAALRQHFAADRAAIARITGLDLSAWAT